MSIKAVKGWALILLMGLILAAGIVLIALQWDSRSQFLLYGMRLEPNTALLMAACVLAGLLLPLVVKGFVNGVLSVSAARRQAAAGQAKKQS